MKTKYAAIPVLAMAFTLSACNEVNDPSICADAIRGYNNALDNVIHLHQEEVVLTERALIAWDNPEEKKLVKDLIIKLGRSRKPETFIE